jgi:hypothetical protein
MIRAVVRAPSKPVRRALLLLAGATGLLVAGCTPAPPTPSGDWQLYAVRPRSGDIPLGTPSCAATPGPLLSETAPTVTQAVEAVDGVNDNVLRFAHGTGLSMANGQSGTGQEVPSETYSIVVLFRLSEIGGYDRLIDIKDGVSDSGVYLRDGSLVFFPDSTAGSRVVRTDEWVQVVVTRSATGSFRGFLDGAQQFQFNDTAGNALIESTLRFFVDNTSGDTTGEHSAGAVARIRLFGRALSTTEIGALGQTPGSPCPT